MTDILVDSYNANENIKINYKKIDNTSHPCIVDITNCIDIKDMLINIENFRLCNYYSDDVDVITNFNTENCSNLQNNTYPRGYFDFYGGECNYAVYYCNLYIKKDLIVESNITAFSSFSFSSDSNLKYDIYKINNSLEKIEKLRPVSFNWKKNNEYEIGFIANEVEEIFPNLIKEGEYKMIKEHKLIPYLVDSIKTLKNRITKIKNARNNRY
jgi:hypothetical protein